MYYLPASVVGWWGEAMFERDVHYCPNCGTPVRQGLKGSEAFVCHHCDTRYKVVRQQETGRIALVREERSEVTEPLNLPRGSIRAMVTIAVSGACWIFVITGKAVPAFLLSLTLTIIGYYFGLRSETARPGGAIEDPTVQRLAPLLLPGGCIRAFIFLGFLVSGIALFAQGRLWEAEYLRFVAVVAGLLLGYGFSRLFPVRGIGAFQVFINHVKGIAVLAVTGILIIFLATGLYREHSAAAFALSAFISFYFGSRS
jgi:hypothetical protein